jgi:hypothetical protein
MKFNAKLEKVREKILPDVRMIQSALKSPGGEKLMEVLDREFGEDLLGPTPYDTSANVGAWKLYRLMCFYRDYKETR